MHKIISHQISLVEDKSTLHYSSMNEAHTFAEIYLKTTHKLRQMIHTKEKKVRRKNCS